MRLVFVNQAHPEVAHVCAMRLWHFARAMADRGHQVVLLTGEAPDQPGVGVTAAEVPERLAGHDWASPLVLPVTGVCGMQAVPPERPLPGPLRRARTAWTLAAGRGTFATWAGHARPVARVLARAFEPQLAWATFGNSSNLVLGQALAHAADCPWVADIKDSWHQFIPRGLRATLARRFGDAAALTANAGTHRDIAARWFGDKPAQVVYSGVADAFYHARGQAPVHNAPMEIVLIGGTYTVAAPRQFLQAFRHWSETHPERDVRVVYAGSDHKRIQALGQETGIVDQLEVHAHLPLTKLAPMLGRAMASAYIGSDYTGFHHKLLELLVVGTPLVCHPDERPEAYTFIENCDTPFLAATDRQALCAAFERALALKESTPAGPAPAWRWQDMAAGLDELFTRIVAGERAPCAA